MPRNSSRWPAAGAGGKGVETTATAEEARAVLNDLALSSGSIVAVSGPVDYITDGHDLIAVRGGDAQLTKVTGAGCALGALIAALLGPRGGCAGCDSRSACDLCRRLGTRGRADPRHGELRDCPRR